MIALLAICLPRVPSFGFNPASPLKQGYGTPVFTRGPTANFTFRVDLDLEMSTSGNLIPLHMNNLHASIYSADTQKLIATGDTHGFTQKGGTSKPLNVSVLFDYSANNDSDTTCKRCLFSLTFSPNVHNRSVGNLVYSACKSSSLYASGSRPGMIHFFL